MNFSKEETINTIQACEQMKERVTAINAVLMGRPFWDHLTSQIKELNDKNMSLVGLAVVTSKRIPTSHAMYFGSVQDAFEMRKGLDDVMGNGGLGWDAVIELIKDGKKWDEEKLKWRQTDK